MRLPLASGALVSRTLLVKRHEERNPADKKDTSGRTLFVTHLDPFVTEAQLKRCFTNAFGPIETVELKSAEKREKKGGKEDKSKVFVRFARVVFKEAATLQKALAAATGRVKAEGVLPPPPSEFKAKVRSAKNFYPDPDELRKELDQWMLVYDQKEEEKQRAAQESQVDEDGFTKVISGVTRVGNMVVHTAKKPPLKTGAYAEAIHGNQDKRKLQRKKKKEKEMPDFYAFQQREQRRGEVEEHRKRKAEAEEKVVRSKKVKRIMETCEPET